MKRLLLINPPNHEFDQFDFAPPLGLLGLGQIAVDSGWSVRILDLSLPCWLEAANQPETFYDAAVNDVIEFEPHLVGLTSMGVNTHVSLLLSRKIRERRPGTQTVVGGTHLSAIADETAQNFPWIDTVVAGEGEVSFRWLLDRIAARLDGRTTEDLPRVLRFPGAALGHPHEAYSLVDLTAYFSVNTRRVIDYEGGRGCVFKCSFCYSPAHYESWRDQDSSTIVADWERLAELGARHVFMVQDNFINDPRSALAIADAIAEAELPLTWSGYATLPQLSQPLARALARSRCSDLYLGVDAVSSHQREVFNKRFFRGEDDLHAKLRMLKDVGVTATCAFIVDLFDYRPPDMEAVFRAATVCADLGMPIRINALAHYPGAAIPPSLSSNLRYCESKLRLMYDCPEVVVQNPLAAELPELFPFHTSSIEQEVYEERLRLIWLGQQMIQTYASDLQDLLESRPETALTSGIAVLADQAKDIHQVPKSHRKELMASLLLNPS